jgi:hypothetical protein
MKLYTIEYQEWNAGAAGGRWFAAGSIWAVSPADAEAEGKAKYGSLGSHYRAFEAATR